MPEENKKVLNKQQLTAITHISGPLLIIAGAGTGKTTVITERVKWLVTQGMAGPEEVLALTFTEKAALEMEERIDAAMPYGFTQMWVMTFHGFCDRILRDEGIHIGLNPRYKLITETSAVSLLRRHLFDFDLKYFRPLGNPNKFLTGILQHFSRLADEDISVDEYLAFAQKQMSALSSVASDPDRLEAQQIMELAGLYRDYEHLKIKEGYLDFANLISHTLNLFRTRPNVLKKYQSKFKFFLVDEFQDTNYAQNELTVLLAGGQKNITVVADDDQAIYRWRGAAVSNVIQFRDRFPHAKLVVLTQNYRSTQEVLDRSYNLISHNNPDRLEIKEGINKKLVSARKVSGEPVRFLHYDRVENEAEAVVKEIIRLRDLEVDFKDIAILVRANAHAEPFSRSLSRHGIPYQFLGPARLFHQPEIKDLYSYLRALDNFVDNASFFRVLSMDFFALSPRDLSALTNFGKSHSLSLFETCEVVAGRLSINRLTGLTITPPLISQNSKETLTKLVDMIHRHLGLLSKETAGQILFYFLQDSGLLSAVLKYETPIDAQKAENIMHFFNKLKSFEAENSDASVHVVIDWIDLSMELGESPRATDIDWGNNNAVNIITIHSAKGLEFPVVFLVNLVSQRFPSMERKEPIPIPDALIKEILPEGDFHLQEERRLFYVGMTRACDRLYFTAADFYGEGKRAKKLSPFVSEALGSGFKDKIETFSQLSLLDDWSKHSVSKSTNPVAPKPPPVPVTYLSYTQIQTFIDCPFHYKAKYILKLSTPPSAASSFGNTIHLTLRDLYSALKDGTLGGKSDIQSAVVEIYKHNWVPEGFHSQAHSKEYFQRGLNYLRKYVSSTLDTARLPFKLEEPFTVHLENLKIGGKIDRVDVLPDGRIEIIDYKTSTKSLTPKEAESNLQLSFYALAATRLPFPPFNKKPGEVLLSLYYFEEQKKVTVIRTAAQLEKAVEEIYSLAEKISLSDYRCNGSVICRHCDFKSLCDIVKTADATG